MKYNTILIGTLAFTLIAGQPLRAQEMAAQQVAGQKQEMINSTVSPNLSDLSAASLLSDKKDHQAEIFDFKGEVRILKSDAEEWIPVSKKMKINAGDQIMTGPDSALDIVYDESFKNIVRIDSQTKAEFVSIEPTQVRLEDGSIFNVLDGLEAGDIYQIATPTAVAGVRGTRFLTSYEAETGIFTEATFSGKVAVSLLDQTENQIDIRHGSQVILNPGASLAMDQVQPLDAEMLERNQKVLNEFSEKFENFQPMREEKEHTLPVELKENPNEMKQDDSDHKIGGGNPPQDPNGTLQMENLNSGKQGNLMLDRMADDLLLEPAPGPMGSGDHRELMPGPEGSNPGLEPRPEMQGDPKMLPEKMPGETSLPMPRDGGLPPQPFYPAHDFQRLDQDGVIQQMRQDTVKQFNYPTGCPPSDPHCNEPKP